jgi:hypothetical protein
MLQFDVMARLAACLGTTAAELLTDNHQIEHLQNYYLDAYASLARLYSVGIGIGKR